MNYMDIMKFLITLQMVLGAVGMVLYSGSKQDTAWMVIVICSATMFIDMRLRELQKVIKDD